MKKQLFFIFLLAGNFFPVLLYSQFVVTGGASISMTPEQFVNTYLLGTGVTVIPGSAKFNGSTGPINSNSNAVANQIGNFSTLGLAQTSLGLSGGIIMSSGNVSGAATGSCTPLENCPVTTSFTGSGGDPDLNVLMSPATSNDKSILEFDFRPETDIVTFRYVFASEEFDFYCNQYNDAFGFLISGPGCGTVPANIFSNNAENIALLPSTTNYVTINNICANKLSYSWCNLTDFSCENGSGPIYSYNRFSYVFTATKSVTPCQIYHMKIALGDAGDNAYDSGVFLEENSFSSNNVTFNNTYTIPSLGEKMVEGCSNVSVAFQIAFPKATDFTINYTLDGTAVPDGPSVSNPDYGITPNPSGTTFPTSITIPAGQTQATLPIYAYQDGNDTESDETITMTVTNVTCAGSTSNTNTIYISNNNVLSVGIIPVSPVCMGSSVTLTAAAAGGQPVYTYTWNDGSHDNPRTLTPPLGTTVFLVDVTDGCNATAGNSTSLVVTPLPAAIIAGSTTVCQGSASPLITFTGSSATAPYTFTYNINGGPDLTVTSIGDIANVPVPTNTVGTLTYNLVSVQDGSTSACSQTQAGSATVNIMPLPIASISGSATVCKNAASPEVLFTGANATAPYIFTYKINGGPDQTVMTTSGNSVTVPVPTGTPGTFTYTLVNVQESSSTSCSQAQAGSAEIVVKALPTASISGSTSVCQNATAPEILFTGANATAPYTFTYKINGGPDLTVTTISGNSVLLPVPTGTPGIFTYSLVSVQESGSNVCVQSQTGDAVITVNPLPAALINGSTTVCKDAVPPLITFTGSNATAPYTFTYNINGGPDQTVTTTSGNSVSIPVPIGTPASYSYTLVSVQESSSTACIQAQTGSASVTVNPLPTAAINGSTTVCQGTTSPEITFTGANATAPYTFTYKINGGPDQTVTTTSGNSVTIAVPTGTPGIYNYSLVSVQESSSTTCSQAQTGSVSVTVNPLPTATVNGSTSVCKDAAPPVITFAGANATAPYTFTYKINGGPDQIVTTTSGNSVSVPVPTTTPGSFNYSLVSVMESSSTACSQAQTGNATVTVNPLPTATIIGSIIVCKDAAPPVITFTGANATAPYTFTYKINGGPDQTVTTTSGNSVNVEVPTGTPGIYNYSLVRVQDGTSTFCQQLQSGSASVTVNSLPDVSFTNCFDPITIRNLPNKIILSGGYPIGAGGVFSGNGVSKNLISGNYEFDPNAVAANSTVTITYTYTDANTCFASKTLNIQVLSANADIIDATHMKDVRDNAVYTYKTLGTQKWMTQNLNYGNKIPYTQTQSDQCNVQKYCFESIDPTCTTFGGSYQWDELMRHDQGEASQGICPPAWHIPTEADWQAIVDAEGGNSTASGALQNSNGLNTMLGGIFYLNNVWAYTPSNTFKASMFWTSTLSGSGKPVARGLNAQGLFPLTPSVPRYESNKANAFPVRCVKN